MLFYNHEEAQRFIDLLHGRLVGFTCFSVKKRLPGGQQAVLIDLFAPPGTIPEARLSNYILGRWDIYAAVCSFKSEERKQANALMAPACWVDLDPPKKNADGDPLVEQELWAYQATLRAKLEVFNPAPSLIVESGRGVYGYWLFDEPVFGDDLPLVRSCNKALAARLDGDPAVVPLQQILRLPSTANWKTGAGICSVVRWDGPRHRLQDLLVDLKVEDVAPPSSRGTPRPTPEGQARDAGAAILGSKTPMPSVRPFYRRLIKEGVAAAANLDNFKKPNGELDRSAADFAVVIELVKAGLTAEQITSVFMDERWMIGAKYRELGTGSQAQADRYLRTTIEKARACSRTS